MYTPHVEDTQPKNKGGRPATGETPKRYIRAGQIWDDATAVAERRGETMTALVLRAIEAELLRLRIEGDA